MSFDASVLPISIVMMAFGGVYIFGSVIHPSELPFFGSIDFTKKRNVVAVRLLGLILLGCGIVVGLLGR